MGDLPLRSTPLARLGERGRRPSSGALLCWNYTDNKFIWFCKRKERYAGGNILTSLSAIFAFIHLSTWASTNVSMNERTNAGTSATASVKDWKNFLVPSLKNCVSIWVRWNERNQWFCLKGAILIFPQFSTLFLHFNSLSKAASFWWKVGLPDDMVTNFSRGAPTWSQNSIWSLSDMQSKKTSHKNVKYFPLTIVGNEDIFWTSEIDA